MSLKEIATQMKHEAQKSGLSERMLQRGLMLTMRREGEAWSLTMKRSGAWPDAREQAIVRNCFGVPRGARGKKDSAGGYCLVKLSWDDKPVKVERPKQLSLIG